MSINKITRCLLVVFCCVSLMTLGVLSDEIDKDTSKVETAVQTGLKWLSDNQNPNGSWTCRIGCKLNEGYIGKEINDNIAVTALAGLSFMAEGSTPGRGKYGKNVTNALNFILSCVRESDGYITKHGSRMYEHAFATLFLAQVYGMSQRSDIKLKLKKAVNLIIQSQNKDGGWRYQPSPIDSDISVTVTTVQALRAARDVGIGVPKTVIEKAMKYIKASAKPDGSFKYQLRTASRTSSALTAAGVVALMSAGDYDSKQVERGLMYILNGRIPRPTGNNYPYHYFYGHYYIAQAMYSGGENYWNKYLPIMRTDVLNAQQNDGHWDDDVGPTYATSMATLILQIPSEYLPIFSK